MSDNYEPLTPCEALFAYSVMLGCLLFWAVAVGYIVGRLTCHSC